MAVLKKPTTQKNHLNIFADWKKKTKVLVRHWPPSKLHFKLQTHTHVYIRCWKVNNIKRAEVIQSTQKRGCFYGKLTAHLAISSQWQRFLGFYPLSTETNSYISTKFQSNLERSLKTEYKLCVPYHLFTALIIFSQSLPQSIKM